MLKKVLNKLFYQNSIKKIDQDNFIKRLPSSVIGQGMLNEGNIYLMDLAIKNMPTGGNILEIGCYGGLSTNLILHLLNKYKKENVKLINCDAWIYEGYNDNPNFLNEYIDGRKDVTRKNFTDYIKNSYINAIKLLHPNNLPYTCHSTSDVFFHKCYNNETLTDVFGREFKIDKKISFCYIDGGHSYQQTKKDFNNVSQIMMKDGHILIDDSADGSNFGSTKFISEIKRNPHFKIVYKNPNYLIQKIK